MASDDHDTFIVTTTFATTLDEQDPVPPTAPAARRHVQSRVDSVMEAVTNTAIGMILSLVTWAIVARAFGIPMPRGENFEITGIFTVVSMARQYIIRRLFDGRSVWTAIKEGTRK